ncbi:snurportin-1-like [Physella acuta]|uniref:snurportin-1-like n=1 Tax=Physella acuta TaxID=109671 RepID=UPI0027DE9D7F|nr:snurportin-1-like [Physella acuta]XP_059160054.1 snurportin-1-like [Physella acuta]
MEELTDALAGSFEISKEPNKTSAPHPRFSQYKQKTSSSDQDSRRKKLLEIQKRHRFDFVNHVRKLTEGDWQSSSQELEENIENEEEMDVEVKLHKPGRYYKDQLMLSEWLVEVPSDFSTEWLTVLCPVAKRCLVVASKGTTRAYTKSGHCINSFPSHLPGGYRKNADKDTTILDCLYSEANRTYYILDLMCWNGHTVYDSETEFRFYWLHEKLKEFSSLSSSSNTNPYIFIGLPSFHCTQEDIALAVSSAEFEIDGVLFYHKRTHYTFGSTPLVVWLKPYMLQEILGIAVPEHQMTHRPEGYSNYAAHMKKVEEDKLNQEKKSSNRGRRKNNRKKQSAMETSSQDVDNIPTSEVNAVTLVA